MGRMIGRDLCRIPDQILDNPSPTPPFPAHQQPPPDLFLIDSGMPVVTKPLNACNRLGIIAWPSSCHSPPPKLILSFVKKHLRFIQHLTPAQCARLEIEQHSLSSCVW